MNDQPARPAALVTGASYGIGAATARALARDGYDLAVTATRRENLDRTVAELEALGARAVPVVLDLTSQQSIKTAIAETAAAFDTVAVLVNNAGGHLRAPALEITPQDWDQVLATNLTGTFFLTQAFARRLVAARMPGAVVNVTSTHGLVGVANRLGYGVSKAALNHMTRMLAIEWAGHGIRVNAVAPGRIDTESPHRRASANHPRYMAEMVERIPLHRLATVEDIAEAVLYLATPRSASVTGHILVVDGGLTVA